MKKHVRKLTLSRETLLGLDLLRQADGARPTSVCGFTNCDSCIDTCYHQATCVNCYG
jgi:hypothetical protein